MEHRMVEHYHNDLENIQSNPLQKEIGPNTHQHLSGDPVIRGRFLRRFLRTV